MVETFKSIDGYANVYVVCRFDECVIINPSHSFHEITNYIGGRTIKGIFITETTRITIDQIGYYDATIYMTQSQYNSLKSNSILGYNNIIKEPFDYLLLKHFIIDDDFKCSLADYQLKPHLIKGSRLDILAIQITNHLFIGGLIKNNNLAQKARYKGAIYDYKKSLKELMGLDKNLMIYSNFDKPKTLVDTISNNHLIKKWLNE